MTAISVIDHIVICVRKMEPFIVFYRDHLGAEVEESRPGKVELRFGDCKISVQTPETIPDIARQTLPGTANLCLVTSEDIDAVCTRLTEAGVEQVSDLQTRDGATGAIRSAHFRDPEGNLVELCNRL